MVWYDPVYGKVKVALAVKRDGTMEGRSEGPVGAVLGSLLGTAVA